MELSNKTLYQLSTCTKLLPNHLSKYSYMQEKVATMNQTSSIDEIETVDVSDRSGSKINRSLSK
uniref:Uncharacterized protein n=1 Tax=Octopus bimaculoides TaxID=37653 RepID=A0A0L8HFM7_OCTBM